MTYIKISYNNLRSFFKCTSLALSAQEIIQGKWPANRLFQSCIAPMGVYQASRNFLARSVSTVFLDKSSRMLAEKVTRKAFEKLQIKVALHNQFVGIFYLVLDWMKNNMSFFIELFKQVASLLEKCFSCSPNKTTIVLHQMRDKAIDASNKKLQEMLISALTPAIKTSLRAIREKAATSLIDFAVVTSMDVLLLKGLHSGSSLLKDRGTNISPNHVLAASSGLYGLCRLRQFYQSYQSQAQRDAYREELKQLFTKELKQLSNLIHSELEKTTVRLNKSQINSITSILIDATLDIVLKEFT